MVLGSELCFKLFFAWPLRLQEAMGLPVGASPAFILSPVLWACRLRLYFLLQCNQLLFSNLIVH